MFGKVWKATKHRMTVEWWCHTSLLVFRYCSMLQLSVEPLLAKSGDDPRSGLDLAGFKISSEFLSSNMWYHQLAQASWNMLKPAPRHGVDLRLTRLTLRCNLQGLTKDGLELALEFLYTAKLEPKFLDDFGEALLVAWCNFWGPRGMKTEADDLQNAVRAAVNNWERYGTCSCIVLQLQKQTSCAYPAFMFRSEISCHCTGTSFSC